MSKRILVSGATGYVGGRLVPRLLASGYPVRCLVRDAKRLQGYPWLNKVEVVEGDALDPASLSNAMQSMEVAYYLIHGMQGGKVMPIADYQAARNFTQIAEQENLERIIYLGELVDPTGNLSPYLRSRHETGYLLRQGGVPVTEFRAGMIVGAGSVLFEMVRYITERQPVLICPRWFYSQAQPIAISDVLEYLVNVLEVPDSLGKLIEIGGATCLTYADMLLGYAHERGLKRIMIPVPVYAPRLSSYWVHLVSPLHWRVVLPLIEGLKAESLVHSDLAQNLFPNLKPLDFPSSVHKALHNFLTDEVETSWDGALVVTQGDLRPVTLTTVEGMMVEKRSLQTHVPAQVAYQAFTGLGGKRGWLYMNWSWVIRGWADKLVGGVGLRRGRRHPDDLRTGEALDFWRVEALEPGRLMRLRAEMKVPGRAWLEYQSIEQADGSTLLTQTAYFAPRGLLGLLYWYLLYPIHSFIFSGMIKKVAGWAESLIDHPS